MNSLVALLAHHGYAVVFWVVFAEAIGLPMPAALALVGAGAAVASGSLSAPVVLLLAIVAMLLGDVVLFAVDSKLGWALLGFLCQVSVNPETCILRSAESFYKRGKLTLVIAKFIPGVNTMAGPVSGSFFFPSRRRHTIFDCDWSSDVCSSDLAPGGGAQGLQHRGIGDEIGRGDHHFAPRTGQRGGPQLRGGARPLGRAFGNDDGGKAESEERRVGKECRSRWSPYH